MDYLGSTMLQEVQPLFFNSLVIAVFSTGDQVVFIQDFIVRILSSLDICRQIPWIENYYDNVSVTSTKCDCICICGMSCGCCSSIKKDDKSD